jgi:predicted 3-demethylubiquinone-9 3-methyltransferase (glyoxalase superfamily)
MADLQAQKITPCLWYDGVAREAAELYINVFQNGQILTKQKSPADNPSTKEGEELVVMFELFGQKFMGLNGGPNFKFSQAISFVVECDDQAEVDRYWDMLTADGGEESQCGWLKDKYGMSWQITPKRLNELTADPDPERAKRVFQCMMEQHKIIISELEAAAEGK